MTPKKKPRRSKTDPENIGKDICSHHKNSRTPSKVWLQSRRAGQWHDKSAVENHSEEIRIIIGGDAS